MSKKDTGNQQQLNELTNRWKLALADYQNLQRRYESEKTDFVAFANSNLILKLLTVLDHLILAGQTTQDQGLLIAISEFEKVLSGEGLTEIAAQNQPFDPNIMEAVELVGGEKDRVIAVITRGFTLKGKLLRPARVQVGNGEVNKRINTNVTNNQ